MNKKVNSGRDSALQSRCKKVKKDHGSQGTQGQKVDSKGQEGEKDERSDLNLTMHECHFDNQSSLQHPMNTSVDEDDKGELDLYRGEEELEQELKEKEQPTQVAAGENQSSVSPPKDLQIYSEIEWKGNTSKSRLIRQGYEAIANKFNLCIVRGDNYCALRATLFQVLSQSKQLPSCLQEPDIIEWPKQLQSDLDLIKEWWFPLESKKNKLELLQDCLILLQKTLQDAVQCKSPHKREHICEQVFLSHNEEYELLEALKFLMLKTAVQLHSDMVKGSDVPEFCWLLFARDSSKNPESLLTNHIRHVGFSGGLEQVEMCLLGYSLQHTIQVYRLYKYDTEEFITYYPNDRMEDWPSLCLLTEDDRHYNALVSKKSPKFDERGRPMWKQPSDAQSLKSTSV